MHPQIRQVGPGSCPICGMALSRPKWSLEDGPNQELADMTRRPLIAAALTVPLVALDMGGHFIAFHSTWLELVLATPVVLWAGWPFFVRGVQSVLRRSLNMFTLIALGTGTAWLYSVAATITGRGELYFESAAVIIVLVLVGQVLELRARDATSGAIKGLLGAWHPRTALRVGHDDRDEEVPIDAIVVGDRLRVRPGEKVPVDGTLSEGTGTVDESTITWRAHAGRQGTRRQGDRGHRQSQRQLRHDRREGRRRHHAGAHRQAGGRGAAQSRAHPAAGRCGWRAGSCRPWCWPRYWPPSPGPCGDRNPGSHTPCWRQCPC